MQRKSLIQNTLPSNPADVANEAKVKEAIDLLSYPVRHRVFELLVKLVGGVGAGGSITLTFTTFFSTGLLWTLGGLVFGIAYGIQAGKQAYNNHVQEKKAIDQINELIDAMLKELYEDKQAKGVLLDNLIASIEFAIAFYALERQLKLEEDDYLESLYYAATELIEVLKYLNVFVTAKIALEKNESKKTSLEKYQTDLKVKLNQIDEQVKTLNPLRGKNADQPPVKPNGYIVPKETPELPPTKKKKVGIFFQKLGNRSLAFVAGAGTMGTIAASVLLILGITVTASFLFTNPIGWGVLGGILVGGIAAAVTDYLISRHQTNKLDRAKQEIEKQTGNISKLNAQVMNIDRVHKHVQSVKNEKKAEEKIAFLTGENETLKRERTKSELQIKEMQNQSFAGDDKSEIERLREIIRQKDEQIKQKEAQEKRLQRENLINSSPASEKEKVWKRPAPSDPMAVQAGRNGAAHFSRPRGNTNQVPDFEKRYTPIKSF